MNNIGINFRCTYQNRLYRSGSLTAFSDIALLYSHYAIQTLFDLRSHDEFEKLSDNTIEHLHFPLKADNGLPIRPHVQDYVAYYQELLIINQNQIREFLLTLIDRIQLGPCLIHCYAGKDRTGVACYLIHRLINTPIQDIKADYVASSKSLLATKEFFSKNAERKQLSLEIYCERFLLCDPLFDAFHKWFSIKYPTMQTFCSSIGLSTDFVITFNHHFRV